MEVLINLILITFFPVLARTSNQKLLKNNKEFKLR